MAKRASWEAGGSGGKSQKSSAPNQLLHPKLITGLLPPALELRDLMIKGVEFQYSPPLIGGSFLGFKFHVLDSKGRFRSCYQTVIRPSPSKLSVRVRIPRVSCLFLCMQALSLTLFYIRVTL